MILLGISVSAASAQQLTPPSQPQTAAAGQQNGQGNQGSPDNGDRRRIRAFRLNDGESLMLDGRLDEPVWARAEPAGDFVQIDPDNGQPATERTEVRIAFDADALYIGVTCYDSDPDGWIAYQRRRDEGLPSDDKIQLTIDTFLDARTGYFFEMNPLGSMADALIDKNGENRAWDGIWNARAQRSDIGWTLEIELPFRTFNFNPGSDAWGINFQRTVQRKNESSIWSGWARNQGLRRMTNAGMVTGILDVTQGHGLDIKPYGLYTSEASPGRGSPRMKGEGSAGFDLFYNPTPLLRTNFTVNTDFAQTEVDQRQVNLTRYSLFFPEQRDFFLDGATFLDFASNNLRNNDDRGGSTHDQVIPFFSRRIGLSTNATPQRIGYGTKVTGQVGAQDVGLLHVRTGEDEGFAGEDFTVGRIKRRMMAQSYIGACTPAEIRPGPVPRRDTPRDSISPWPHRHFAATRTSSSRRGFCTRRGPTRRAAIQPSVPPSSIRTIAGTFVSIRPRFRRTSTRRSGSCGARTTGGMRPGFGSGRGRVIARISDSSGSTAPST